MGSVWVSLLVAFVGTVDRSRDGEPECSPTPLVFLIQRPVKGHNRPSRTCDDGQPGDWDGWFSLNLWNRRTPAWGENGAGLESPSAAPKTAPKRCHGACECHGVGDILVMRFRDAIVSQIHHRASDEAPSCGDLICRRLSAFRESHGRDPWRRSSPLLAYEECEAPHVPIQRSSRGSYQVS